MLCAMIMFAAADACAKLLTASFHPVQIMWSRQLALLLVVVFLLLRHGPAILKTTRTGLQIGRGALAVCSGLLFIYAVKFVPLADAVAASFVAPFFLTMMGAFFLGEKVGIRRWSAVVIGFIGALIIVRPGMGVIHPAAMLVVIAAGFYAARQITGRLLADTDSTITTICYTGITASLLTTLPLPFVWQWPDTSSQLMLLVAMSLLAGTGEILVIRALEVSEAVVLAPIHYTLIIWGTIYGYLIFNQLPDLWTWLGTTIIVAAGIYTLHRDVKSRAEADAQTLQ
ncbi:MAG: DMT family transporter [Gammaproteobacteria bacterium]|nr:DMT family transporter [Gammaproteobacteria bacterium]